MREVSGLSDENSGGAAICAAPLVGDSGFDTVWVMLIALGNLVICIINHTFLLAQENNFRVLKLFQKLLMHGLFFV